MKKLKEVLTITAALATGIFAGVIFITKARRRSPRSNRLFLYRLNPDTFEFDKAAVAMLDPYSFEIKHYFTTLPFTTTYQVISAANGKNKWLLFRLLDGGAATGLVDGNLNFTLYKYYPPGTFSWPGTIVVVDGRGYLLAIGPSLIPDNINAMSITFSQVLDDGTYVEWWRTEVPIPFPDLIVGLPNGHAFYLRDRSGPGSTVYIFDVKHARIISTRRWEEQWYDMVSDGNILYFYTMNARSETCVLDENHQLITIKKTPYDHDLIDFYDAGLTFTRVTSTSGEQLCWAYESKGSASIRVLSRDGFRLSQIVKIDDYWSDIVRC